MEGISQAALARELGVNRSTITYHVKRGLTFDQIRELVTALKKIREEDEEEEDDEDDGENDENSIAFLRKAVGAVQRAFFHFFMTFRTFHRQSSLTDFPDNSETPP